MLCHRWARRRPWFGSSEGALSNKASSISASNNAVQYLSGHLPPRHDSPAQDSTSQRSTCLALPCLALLSHTELVIAHARRVQLFFASTSIINSSQSSASSYAQPAAAARASKWAGVAAHCQRHVSATQVSKGFTRDAMLRDLAGGGVASTSHRTLIEATTLASLHAETDGPAQRPLGCAVV